ncbi:MAG TPA: acetyl-coenzyme A synthetase N-terminal domain-containing protein, partial [Chthoniobacteraceae bacterium]|nr:acetyl-coenzyme A synthetase N-terminal domain-containing protein [Chthoniobacteraceae bacterium]
MSYTSQHAEALRDPEGFWRRQAEALEWFRFPEQILTRDADGMARWFADGELNTAYLCLDHHVKHGRGDQLALVYDSPVTDSKARFTYRE